MDDSLLKRALRLLASAVFGFVMFFAAMFAEFALWPVSMKMKPRTDPMQDGLSLVRWDLLGSVAFFVAVAATVLFYLVLHRRARRVVFRRA